MRELDDREPCPCGRDALYGGVLQVGLVSGGIEKGISFINNTMLIFRKRGWIF